MPDFLLNCSVQPLTFPSQLSASGMLPPVARQYVQTALAQASFPTMQMVRDFAGLSSKAAVIVARGRL